MEITLLHRLVRYGQTMNRWTFLECEADPVNVEVITETLGLRRAEATEILSSPGIKRSMDDFKTPTDLSEYHARN